MVCGARWGRRPLGCPHTSVRRATPLSPDVLPETEPRLRIVVLVDGPVAVVPLCRPCDVSRPHGARACDVGNSGRLVCSRVPPRVTSSQRSSRGCSAGDGAAPLVTWELPAAPASRWNLPPPGVGVTCPPVCPPARPSLPRLTRFV